MHFSNTDQWNFSCGEYQCNDLLSANLCKRVYSSSCSSPTALTASRLFVQWHSANVQRHTKESGSSFKGDCSIVLLNGHWDGTVSGDVSLLLQPPNTLIFKRCFVYNGWETGLFSYWESVIRRKLGITGLPSSSLRQLCQELLKPGLSLYRGWDCSTSH